MSSVTVQQPVTERVSPVAGMEGALSGIRVADFSWGLAAPFGTDVLAYMGAEVIVIENRKRLGSGRQFMDPTHHKLMGGKEPNKAMLFNVLNPNKLGVTLDLTTQEGLDLAKRLVAVSDVVVESFSPGVMARFGLGYEAVRKLRPDAIMLSMSACGNTGPESAFRGYAPVFSALAGLGHMTGYGDGHPTEIRYSADIVIGMNLGFALTVALVHRQRTGEGQYIDLSAREAHSILIGDSFMDYTLNGRVQQRMGNELPGWAPHNCYRCSGKERWISIAVHTEGEWQALCQVMGQPAWAKQEKFGSQCERWKHREELDQRMNAWTKFHTVEELTAKLQAAGVAAFPSMNTVDLFGDEHLQSRGYFETLEHPEAGPHLCLTPPWKLDDGSAKLARHAPCIGEHNAFVLSDMLGVPEAELARLERRGALS